MMKYLRLRCGKQWQWLFLLPLLFFTCQSTEKPIPAEETLFNIIERKPEHIQRFWTIYDIKLVGKIIDNLNEKTDIPKMVFIKLIAHESGFDPNAINRNSNGSIDIGITQQNSKYAQKRAKALFGNYVHWKALKNIEVSILLFEHYFSWCWKTYPNQFQAVTCYNSPRNATRKHFAYHTRVLETPI
jgi:hypothetical protein